MIMLQPCMLTKSNVWHKSFILLSGVERRRFNHRAPSTHTHHRRTRTIDSHAPSTHTHHRLTRTIGSHAPSTHTHHRLTRTVDPHAPSTHTHTTHHHHVCHCAMHPAHTYHPYRPPPFCSVLCDPPPLLFFPSKCNYSTKLGRGGGGFTIVYKLQYIYFSLYT